MPTATRSRTISAPAADLWAVVSDPHHLPRWWPRVQRVEDFDGHAFTEALRSDRGRIVRADFELVERDERQMRVHWSQTIAGTPFARVLESSETEVRLTPVSGPDAEAATEVLITLSQKPLRPFSRSAASTASMPMGRSLHGLFANLGSPMIRRAANATVKEALDGLQRISG